MNEYQPIQIIGTQRSGSNMLRLMLNQIDEISAPHPPHILQRFFPLLPHYGSLQIAANFETLVDDVCTLIERNPVPWTGISFDREKIVQECKQNSLPEIFRVVYEQKAKADGATLWACKSMANVEFAGDIEAAGLRPLYIHLYRDGRDVACSFRKAVVGEKHVYHIANQWKTDQELCLELEEKIDTHRFLKVCYEHLIADPAKELKRIGEFLNVQIPAKVFDFYKSDESQKTAVAGKMWENVRKPVQKNNSNKFKSELSEFDIALFEKQAGTMLERLGYLCDRSNIINGRNFTDDELRTFDRENALLKKQALAMADPEGMKLREGQDRLLKDIKERKPRSLERA